MDFETYNDAIRQDAQNCLQVMGLQPILFIGSGLSQRYFQGPSWEGLLAQMASQCPLIEKDFAYYKQRHRIFPEIGTVFAEDYGLAAAAARKPTVRVRQLQDAPHKRLSQESPSLGKSLQRATYFQMLARHPSSS